MSDKDGDTPERRQPVPNRDNRPPLPKRGRLSPRRELAQKVTESLARKAIARQLPGATLATLSPLAPASTQRNEGSSNRDVGNVVGHLMHLTADDVDAIIPPANEHSRSSSPRPATPGSQTDQSASSSANSDATGSDEVTPPGFKRVNERTRKNILVPIQSPLIPAETRASRTNQPETAVSGVSRSVSNDSSRSRGKGVATIKDANSAAGGSRMSTRRTMKTTAGRGLAGLMGPTLEEMEDDGFPKAKPGRKKGTTSAEPGVVKIEPGRPKSDKPEPVGEKRRPGRPPKTADSRTASVKDAHAAQTRPKSATSDASSGSEADTADDPQLSSRSDANNAVQSHGSGGGRTPTSAGSNTSVHPKTPVSHRISTNTLGNENFQDIPTGYGEDDDSQVVLYTGADGSAPGPSSAVDNAEEGRSGIDAAVVTRGSPEEATRDQSAAEPSKGSRVFGPEMQTALGRVYKSTSDQRNSDDWWGDSEASPFKEEEKAKGAHGTGRTPDHAKKRKGFRSFRDFPEGIAEVTGVKATPSGVEVSVAGMRIRRALGNGQPHAQPQISSSRQHLMRQQYYTNNERTTSRSKVFWPEESSQQVNDIERRRPKNLTQQPPAASGRHTTARYKFNHLHDNVMPHISRANTTSDKSNNHLPPSAISSDQNTTTHSSIWADCDTTANSLATGASQLPRECLQQYNPAYHSASPSMPSSGDSNYLADCISAGDCGSNSTATDSGSPADCGDQFALMNIRTEELNFADTEQVWLVKSWPEILARVSCVTPIVLLGLIGNLTIIYSMCRFKPIRSKPTNIFILNMALADLLTAIVCPNAALLTDIYQFYVMGAFVCRTEGFIKITCLLVSAYSLIVLSFDWFLSVVKPCRTRITIKQSWMTLVCIWLVSVSMASPLLHWRRLRERQWRDVTEIWCCELIQYTKYYWIGITLFLIYLPTFVMTIVLVVILARMDRFEAKLRKSRTAGGQGLARPTTSSLAGSALTSPAASGMSRGPSSSLAPSAPHTSNHHQISPTPSNSTRISITNTLSNSQKQTTHQANKWQPASTSAGGGYSASNRSISERQLNSSLTLGMKYRRRIVKILFFYLLTSIVCWTPLQFTIIYRHFRSDPVPAGWFFELTFYSQLSASLSGAMNPIIFGFLSQPFRRVVTKSWMFRFLDKVWRSRSDAGGGGNAHANPMINLAAPNQRNGATAGARVARQRAVEQEAKLNIDYVEHRPSHRHFGPATSIRQSELNRRAAGRVNNHQMRPLSANLTTANGASSTSKNTNHSFQSTIKRTRSSAHQTPAATSASSHKRVVFDGKTGGLENAAYTRDGDGEESSKPNDKTTSFIVAGSPITNQTTALNQNGTHSKQKATPDKK